MTLYHPLTQAFPLRLPHSTSSFMPRDGLYESRVSRPCSGPREFIGPQQVTFSSQNPVSLSRLRFLAQHRAPDPRTTICIETYLVDYSG